MAALLAQVLFYFTLFLLTAGVVTLVAWVLPRSVVDRMESRIWK